MDGRTGVQRTFRTEWSQRDGVCYYIGAPRKAAQRVSRSAIVAPSTRTSILRRSRSAARARAPAVLAGIVTRALLTSSHYTVT